MNFFEPFQIAFQLIYNFDPETYSIIFLSLKVSLTALLFASLIGIPIGATLASFEFKGKNFCILFFNTLLSMPPVVLGLLVYILISQSGPFGFLDLLGCRRHWRHDVRTAVHTRCHNAPAASGEWKWWRR